MDKTAEKQKFIADLDYLMKQTMDKLVNDEIRIMKNSTFGWFFDGIDWEETGEEL